MFNSITLLGSSSGRNAGDAALIAGIMDGIDDALGKSLLYEIPTIRPSYIRDNYHNKTKSVGMMPWHGSIKMFGLPTYNSIMRTDLSLIFDAILFDRSLYNPLFNYMWSVSKMLSAAKKKGKKMGLYNVGAGPVDTKAGQDILRDLAEDMDFITVRDSASLKLLKDLGVKNPNILLTADAALTVKPSDELRVASIMKSLGFGLNEEILGININAYLDTWVRPKLGTDVKAKRTSMGKERFLSIYSEALNRFLKDTGVPVMFISTQHHDVSVTTELMSLVNVPVKKNIFSNVTYNHYDVKGVMGKLSMLFGMRLHSTILSASALTPTLGLTYQPKVADFFNTLGQGDLSLSFDNFTPEGIYNHLVKGWDNRASIKETLKKMIPVRQRDALIAASLVASLSKGESINHYFENQKVSASLNS